MLRFISLLTLMTVMTMSAWAGTVTLSEKNLITGDHVTVGDIFDNAGSSATRILAPAPFPGKPLVLSKSDLQKIVKAFRLDWDAEGAPSSITLVSDNYAISAEDITKALLKSDLQEKISADASFNLGDSFKPIVIDGQAVPELVISTTAFDPATEKFSAILNIKRDDAIIKTISLSGLATPMVTLPVLRNSLTSTAVISKSDLITQTMPKNKIRPGTIMRTEELIGMMPKRTLNAGQPVVENDVIPPMMVKRNQLVDVTYVNGPIRLSTKARAMSNAAKGDSVTLVNTSSKKTFEAIVTGSQQAEVSLNTL